MSKTAIFYGSSTGNTEAAAKVMAEQLNADVFDVAGKPTAKLAEYDNLILGTSTWGVGDLQDDWEEFVTELDEANLDGKVVAIFGFGDSESYADSFVDAIGTLYKTIRNKGCIIVGACDTEEYDYVESKAEVDGKFAGLPLDEENQDHLTDSRIETWLAKIQPKFI